MRIKLESLKDKNEDAEINYVISRLSGSAFPASNENYLDYIRTSGTCTGLHSRLPRKSKVILKFGGSGSCGMENAKRLALMSINRRVWCVLWEHGKEDDSSVDRLLTSSSNLTY